MTPRKSAGGKSAKQPRKRTDFATKLRNECGFWPFDPTLLERWYAELIKGLRSARQRCRTIKHPRSHGDAIEQEVLALLSSIFPPGILLRRGFAVSRLSTPSREQDVLVLDSHRAISIVNSKSEPYFPLESVFGSFEIKASLTSRDLRSSFINCASLKKLSTFFKEGDEAIKEADAINYCVLALDSAYSLEDIVAMANKISISNLFHLLPDSIWILGKGLVLKGDESRFLQLRSKQDKRTRYKSFRTLNVQEDDQIAHSLLWAILSMVQHCEDRRMATLPIDFLSYLSYPFSMKQMTDKAVADHEADKALSEQPDTEPEV
ncbi:MAG TPA: DUF6602 domain-containing protein [Allosphingosinicella sp.]